MRSAIRSGRLGAGTRLPASRVLAADLGMARNSVAEVYGQLVAEGWLLARAGSGTWVSGLPAGAAGSALTPPTARLALDLRGGIPDASTFPRSEWSSAARRAINAASADSFGYQAAQGVDRLRDILAEYLARTRGVFATPDDVFIAHGFGDLLAVVCRALRASGARRVAVEEYGHAAHRAIIAAAGLTVIPIAVDDDGAVVTELDAGGADAVLLTAAHQFPTGVPLSASRRIELIQWAERTDGLVIEDDYDGEFRYDRRSIGALQALAPQHVIYAGTASKSLAPAVGLAWGVIPDRLMPGLVEQRTLLGSTADVLAQITLAEFMRGHQYDRHLRQQRARYRNRREELERTFTALVPGTRISGLSAGLHCLVELPPGVLEADVTVEAAQHGLSFEGLSTYLPEGRLASRAPAMVVGYGAPQQRYYPAALRAAVSAIMRAV
ncbi:PLP-dependent aminotransferase family protein [Leifsonia kafniensis]|uniref:PLP-dependent aminotransferase family protein n=1 Tax=Leifsonia kafniensis TaxID=475957 RepID=A0ABP7L6S3_9MICO